MCLLVDIVDAGTRSRMMAAIKGKDTRPEWIIRSTLHRAGFRFRLHDRRLPGAPDLTLPKYGAAVFVHGCFWHRHSGCEYATTPATRPAFWKEKFASNIARDRRNQSALIELDWRVLVVWECGLRHDADAVIGELIERLSCREGTIWNIPAKPPRTGK